MKTTLLFLAAIASVASYAQNIFQDDFSTYNTGVDLHGQGTWTHNSSLPGGLGAAIGAIPNNADVLAAPLSYLNYGASANAVAISADSDGVGTSFTAVTNGDIYVAFVLNLSAAQANNNSDFFRVMSGANLNTTFRLYAINSGFSYFLAASKGVNGNAIVNSALSYNYNEDHLVVVKYSQLPGANDDVVSLYVDPVFINGVPSTPSAITNTGADQSGNIDRLAFRMNWTNGMPTGKAGLVSVANTWEGLSFIALGTNQFEANTIKISTDHATNGILTLASSEAIKNATIRIIALNGAVIENKTVSIAAQTDQININALKSNGVYIVEILDDQGKRFTQKIIIP